MQRLGSVFPELRSVGASDVDEPSPGEGATPAENIEMFDAGPHGGGALPIPSLAVALAIRDNKGELGEQQPGMAIQSDMHPRGVKA